jgi:hypothetical protein
MVLGLIILTVIIIAIIQYLKYKKNAYRREGVKKIEIIAHEKNENLVFEINALLKSMAMALFGRKNVAALYGIEWFRFLQSKLKTKPVIAEQNFEEYTKALYNKEYKLNEDAANELVEFSIIWVKNHLVNV